MAYQFGQNFGRHHGRLQMVCGHVFGCYVCFCPSNCLCLVLPGRHEGNYIAIILHFIANITFFKLQLLQVMYCVLGPLITLAAVVILINVIQNHRSHWLPHCLRDWSFLPVWMRSLQPLDDLFSQFSCCSKCMTPPMDQIQEDFKDIEAAIALNANAEEMENFVNANGRKPKIIVA